MKQYFKYIYPIELVLILCLLTGNYAITADASTGRVLFPEHNAANVNPDTLLKLIFEDTPVLGKSGCIRIYDAVDDRLVDILDLSIPSGPTKPTMSPDAIYTPVPYKYVSGHFTNANTRAGTPSGEALPASDKYQLTIIGGFTDGFHFHPVIIRENTATIYPHNNLLDYNKTYYFAADHSKGIHMVDLTVKNTSYGQAEGLLLNGEKFIVRNVSIIGSGDAPQSNGSAYYTDCRIIGDGDTILGRGPAFFKNCELNSYGPYMWIRNTSLNHGNIFVDCVFKTHSLSSDICQDILNLNLKYSIFSNI